MILDFNINSKKYDFRIKEFGDGVFVLDEVKSAWATYKAEQETK